MPKPFFTKLIAIGAIGFFCVLFGCVFGIVTQDKLFFMMSLLIGGCCIVRFAAFYHLIRTHAYYTLDGICKKRERTLFGKTQQFLFMDKSGTEYSFSLNKDIKILQGHSYRLYFRKAIPTTTPSDTALHSSDFLAYEEVSFPSTNL